MLRKLYDWTMAKAAHRHAEWWLAGLSFVEASFFPVPPHPLLGIMCLAEPKKAIRFAMIATFASVAGGLLGYAIGWGLYDTVGDWLLEVLGLTESFPAAVCYLNEYGFWLFVAKGATPIPFKLLTITAGFIGMGSRGNGDGQGGQGDRDGTQVQLVGIRFHFTSPSVPGGIAGQERDAGGGVSGAGDRA